MKKMKKNYAKVGIVLIVAGLVMFGTALWALNIERQNYGELSSIPNFLFYNYTALIGIPVSLFGASLMVGSFVSRYPAPIMVGLTAPFFIGMWFMFLFSRGS